VGHHRANEGKYDSYYEEAKSPLFQVVCQNSQRVWQWWNFKNIA
jgi:hypothetical protein